MTLHGDETFHHCLSLAVSVTLCVVVQSLTITLYGTAEGWNPLVVVGYTTLLRVSHSVGPRRGIDCLQ